MVHVLTGDQISQIVNQTLLVLLVHPDLLDDWRANLLGLMAQAREQRLEDEMIFLAAVLALLQSPHDRLPTGTVYDYAWEALMAGLATGIIRSLSRELDRLLLSVAEATLEVFRRAPEQRSAVIHELSSVVEAVQDAEVPELIAWLEDVLALLNGAAPNGLGARHQGVYAAYWDALTRGLVGSP